MLQLLIKDEFVCSINNCEKTQIIRKGERFISDRKLLLVPTGESGLDKEEDKIKAVITGISYKTLWEITNQDAELDGFEDKRELQEVLDSIYPDLEPETVFTLIQFEV